MGENMRGILFDMDGVLCDSEPFLYEAARQMFEERYNLRLAREDFAPFVGTGEDRYLGGVAEVKGISLRMPDDKEYTYVIYLEIIRGRLRALPGVHDFIKAARAAGYRLAVASSADRVKLNGNLNEIGLPSSQFDTVLTGSDVERKKPAPDLFLKAAEQIGLPPSACWVIEDSPSGLQAARAGGFRSVGLTSTFPADVLRAAGADHTAPDLAHFSVSELCSPRDAS